MITWSKDEGLQQVITRDIPSSEAGSITSFNDFPAWMIDEARTIAHESKRGASDYIDFYLAEPAPRLLIAEFIKEVVLDRTSAATWRTHDCLCTPSEQTHTSLLTANHIDVLADVEGERWFRIMDPRDRHPASSSYGAVGVVQRGVQCWRESSEPDSITRVILGSDEIEAVPPAELASSVRRWIARRMAWRAQSYLKKASAAVAAQGIIDNLAGKEPIVVTRDAAIAASALAREVREHGAEVDFVQRAGFLGPEVWYAG